MTQHNCPPPSEIVQRYRFHSRFRQPEESVATYISELRALAQWCIFGSSLEDMLRDRLVCGINNEAIQRRLLSETSLTFAKAWELAQSHETAAKNAQETKNSVPRGPPVPDETQVHKLSPPVTDETQVHKLTSGSCFRCGYDSHVPSLCPFRNAKCYNCSRTGHVRRTCRGRRGGRTQGQPSTLLPRVF